MKQLTLTILACLLTLFSFGQLSEEKEIRRTIDSIEKSFKYEHGTIELEGGIAQITIPEGFKYLNAEQSENVLVNYWNNPKNDNMTMGLILPEKQGVLGDTGYVFNIQYDKIGFVKDDDADEINYDDLLSEMKKDAEEANKERKEAGYEAIEIVGWAAKPFYDKDKKILHWAKEVKFGDEPINTLNYNVRILGRKGVLVLNAIATMSNIAAVQKGVPKVLDIVTFKDGNKYSDFNPSIDQVAALTIGGLVAGKVLAKAGFFAILLKFGKVIGVAVLAFFGGLWRKITGKKEE